MACGAQFTDVRFSYAFSSNRYSIPYTALCASYFVILSPPVYQYFIITRRLSCWLCTALLFLDFKDRGGRVGFVQAAIVFCSCLYAVQKIIGLYYLYLAIPIICQTMQDIQLKYNVF